MKMNFEEWLKSESVVNSFGHVINFSNSAVELARAAWIASWEAAQQSAQSDGAWDCQKCKKPNIAVAVNCWFCETPRR